MSRLLVEVITHAPTEYFQCNRCEVVYRLGAANEMKKFRTDASQTSLPADLLEEYQALMAWVFDAAERYGERVEFKVIDATTLEGLAKSLRYGARHYPVIVIGGKEKQAGADFKRADASIEKYLVLEPV